jgi:phospholipase C
VPFLVVSPLARRRHVSHAVLEHTSILRLIEWRRDLPALTVRDESATNLAEILVRTPEPRAPRFAVPPPPLPGLCLPGVAGRRIGALPLTPRESRRAGGCRR